MIALPKPQKYTARVAAKEKISPKVYQMRFELVSPTMMTYLAGQTVMFHVAEGVNRSMSIASAPSDSAGFIVAHDVSPNGVYSKWTLNAKVGDTITFMGPLGIFVMDKESHRKKVMVATGTGAAPFLGMLHDYLDNGGTDDVTLYWGMRYEDDVFWYDQFQELAAKYPNFRFVLTLSQPTDTWAGKRGHVQEHVIKDELHITNTDFYLCGSNAMIADMKNILAEKNVPKEQVRSELFF